VKHTQPNYEDIAYHRVINSWRPLLT